MLDCVVIGAGVIGLAVARAQAIAGRAVLVVEAGWAIGTGISSRHSEVIHAGLYYPPESYKAKLCIRGRELLYAYCQERAIAHRKIGKLVVATSAAQLPALEALRSNAEASGVGDLSWCEGTDILRLEPELKATAALLSPSSGVIDSHAYMLALQADAESHGALFAFRSPLIGASLLSEGARLHIGGSEPMTLSARLVVNCAGLDAQRVARTIDGLDAAQIPAEAYAKGSYFALASRSPFAHLIYPLPEQGGLGVHLTLDLAGRARFGPDVQWVDQLDYQVDPARSIRFYDAIRRYWPGLPDAALIPDYAGIRPKLAASIGGFGDFIFSGPQEHGARGIYNLYGIESPGLTSSLAIAEHLGGQIDS